MFQNTNQNIILTLMERIHPQNMKPEALWKQTWQRHVPRFYAPCFSKMVGMSEGFCLTEKLVLTLQNSEIHG
jgi:hypothetical protein